MSANRNHYQTATNFCIHRKFSAPKLLPETKIKVRSRNIRNLPTMGAAKTTTINSGASSPKITNLTINNFGNSQKKLYKVSLKGAIKINDKRTNYLKKNKDYLHKV